ncbi:peptide synthetase, partial [Streptococcus thermophilus]|nr:peptide synthetase [Streptococcus thermophilus]
NIIVLNNLPTELELQGILDNIEVIPIPIIVVGTRDKKVRFYFPYHSIDASSLNKLGDTVYQLYEKKIVIDEVPSSSLVAFSQFKREVLQNDVSGDVLARLPKIKPAIEFEKLNDEVQCFQVSLPEDIKGDDVYLFTIYAISQCILSDYNLSAISGGLSLDFRDYEQFDAYDLIGDIHKKIPFQVNRTETFEEFKNSHFKILEIYRTGIDYYEIAMLGNDMSAKEVQERLNNLSLSINFIGEAFRLKDTVNNIIDVDFDKNFINVFVYGRFAYAVIKSELLSNSVYDLMHKDSKFELKVIDKKRLENEETNR